MALVEILVAGIVGAIVGSVTTEGLQRARGKRDDLRIEIKELRAQLFELTRRFDTLKHIEANIEQRGQQIADQFFKGGASARGLES